MEAQLYSAEQLQDQSRLDKLDEYIDLIGRAQEEDGYISTKQIIGMRNGTRKGRLGDINEFEVYNMGHLFTSACLYKRITGKENFLNIARKAADFVKFCDAFDIPVLTLTNATGFMATLCSEKMMAKSVGELVAAFADATVPKVNVIIGKAYGTAYVAMNSKSIGADLVYAWDNAEIGMMDASLAAKIMYADADAAELNEKAAQYRELQNGVASAAARGYVDTVISPADTRKYVIGAFEMLFTKREDRPSKKHGTV